MLAISVVGVLVLIILVVVFIEYKNNKKYKEQRQSKREKTQKRPTRETKPKEVVKPVRKPIQSAPPKPKPAPAKKLPQANYPPFTHVRLLEMGLSDEEAKEFVAELIPQLEAQIPLIQNELNSGDFHQMERLTHSIKGSATNIGTGGVSDLLVECNTYLKSGTDIDIATAYFKHLVAYTAQLKQQYA